MTTFLKICQDVARETKIDRLGTLPLAVADQTGKLLDVVNWVIDAHNELQRRHGGQWRWLRRPFSLDTVDGTGKYAFGDCTDTLASATITRFRRWRLNDPRFPPIIFLTASGQTSSTWKGWVTWEYWNQVYGISTGLTNKSFPFHVTVDPQDNIRLGPIPNDVYTLSGEYWRGNQVFDITGDELEEPEMPEDFHDVVRWLAVEKYSYDESAEEVLAKAVRYSRPLIRNLEIDQLPKMRKRGPLA